MFSSLSVRARGAVEETVGIAPARLVGFARVLSLRLVDARALWMSVDGDEVVSLLPRRPRLLGFHFPTGRSLPRPRRGKAFSGRQGPCRAPALAHKLTLFTS